MIIALEGVDKLGKSTQIQQLKDFFCKNVYVFKFPKNKEDIKKIKGFTQLQIFFVNERYDAAEDIKRLSPENIVLLDRFSLSGIAYGVSRGLHRRFCEELEKKLPTPDFTFILVCDNVRELYTNKNIQFDDNKIQFLEKVNEFYKNFPENRNVIKINVTGKNVTDVSQIILSHIKL